MKAGDWVTVYNTSGNFDEKQFPNPHVFDPERQHNRHYTLSGGIHLCLGAHLAKRELRVLLDEWFKRIPSFEAVPGVSHGFRIGTVTATSSGTRERCRHRRTVAL